MDKSQQNYLRIVAVVYGPGLNAVRSYFDRCFPPNLLNIQLSGVLRKRLEVLKQKKVMTNAQWDTLFPANGSVSSCMFDVAIMTLLLRHFHIKTEPSGGYDVLPPDHDQTPAADLARIKFYRNLIAHSKDGTIDEECYEEAWRHLYSVVDRLGDAHLKQDCDLLGRVDLNMAYKSLCEELSRNIETLREHASALESSQDQLTSDLIKQEKISRINENIIKQLIEDIQSKNKEAVCILETRMNNLKIQLDGMLDHLNTQQSAIPCYMKAKIVRQIKTWIDDEKKYVIIDAEMDAVDLLKKHSFLTVAGNAGCGKTAFIRHLALHFMAQGYEVVPVIEPKSIVEYHDETRKQVFVLDDVCGVHTVDQQKRGAWLVYGHVIQDCVLQSGSLLLVSVRLSIFNSESFHDLKVLSQNVINLKDKKYALSLKTRQDIFRSYFKKGYEELGITDKSLNAHDAFPLLCRISSRSLYIVEDDDKENLDSKSENIINDLDTFFQTPIPVIECDIKSLRIDSPVSYCVLVLCLLFNGRLPKHDLFYSNRHKKLLKDCLSVCGLNRGTSIKTVYDICQSLIDVYLKEVDGTFMFIHDIIMDIVSVCFGEHSPDIILKHANIEIILERVQLQKNTETIGYKIFIPKDHHFDFFHRLYTEIKIGNVWRIFNHCQLEIQWVQKAFSNYLEKKSNDELRSIFFLVEDKKGDRHQKLLLKLMDIWAQTLDINPVNLEFQSYLDFIVNKAFYCLLGKGLFEMIELLERRVCSDVYNELFKADSACTFIAILGGNIKIYSWILNVQKKRTLWRNLRYKLLQNTFLIQDFRLAVVTGRTNIVECLLHYDICKTCLNESITPDDLLPIIGKLLGFSVYKERVKLFLTKFIQKHILNLNCGFDWSEFNLDNFIMYYRKEGYMLFFTKDDNFNKLIYKKFNSDVQPIVTKLFQNRVEFQCPLFPLQQTIGDEIQGRMKVQPTCIALAAKLGHESVVNLLLLNGSNPNKINIPSNNVAKLRTALPVVYAAMYGRLSIVRNLLQNGAHIESTGPMGCTLLIFASSYGHYDLAKFLLDKHVDINATNMFQNTALLYGSKKGHTNIVNLLLENGALTNTVCNKSSTPLIEAASGGHLEIVEKLLSCFSSVNACDNKNMNALTKAAKNGHYIIVERLIENQAAVNIPTHKSETALMIACRKGHSMVVSILIKHMHECLNNRYIIMEKDCSTLEIETRIAFSQLPYGFFSPSIAEESEEMNQALLVAYENKRIAIMKFLLDNGANVQIERCTSLSLLNAAVSKGEYEIVDLLLKNGAQVQKRANFGIPSLTLASNRGHTDIVTVLLKNNANINSKADRLTIPLTSQENIWLQQKRNKSDLNNIETDNGGTALIYASLNGSLELINSLLQDKNININSQTYMGRTALMIACGSGREDVVELLLRYHPELNIRSKLGATALDIAFMSKMESTNIVRRLIQNGATRSSRRHGTFPEPNELRTLRSEYLPKILNRIAFLLRFAFIFVLSKLIVFC